MMLTMDDALKIVRAEKTSHLTETILGKDKKGIDITLNGSADTKTYVYLFTEKDKKITQRLVEIPEFDGAVKVSVLNSLSNNIVLSK